MPGSLGDPASTCALPEPLRPYASTQALMPFMTPDTRPLTSLNTCSCPCARPWRTPAQHALHANVALGILIGCALGCCTLRACNALSSSAAKMATGKALGCHAGIVCLDRESLLQNTSTACKLIDAPSGKCCHARRVGHTSEGGMTRLQVRVFASAFSEAASTTVRPSTALTQCSARKACSPLVMGRRRATILQACKCHRP